MKILKVIKHVWLFLKWQRSDECKLFELLLELRTEVLTNNFVSFRSHFGICLNVEARAGNIRSARELVHKLCTEFVELYPHAPDVYVDPNYKPHYYAVDGNHKAYAESFRLNQLWFNPRRLQLLDFMIMELYNTKPEL